MPKSPVPKKSPVKQAAPKKPAPKKPAPKPPGAKKKVASLDHWDGKISPDAFAEALAESKAAERKQGKQFPGGKPFPVPDQDADSVLLDEQAKRPSKKK